MRIRCSTSASAYASKMFGGIDELDEYFSTIDSRQRHSIHRKWPRRTQQRGEELRRVREVREVARPLDDDQFLSRRFDVLEEGVRPSPSACWGRRDPG